MREKGEEPKGTLEQTKLQLSPLDMSKATDKQGGAGGAGGVGEENIFSSLLTLQSEFGGILGGKSPSTKFKMTVKPGNIEHFGIR